MSFRGSLSLPGRGTTACVRSKINIMVPMQHYASQSRLGLKRVAKTKTLKEMAGAPTEGTGTSTALSLI